MSLLNEVDLHVTNNCNLHCKHCLYMSGDIKMEDITIQDVKKMSNSLCKLGVKEIHLTGGEPLVNRDIFDITQYLHDRGYEVRLQTNGLLIDRDTVKKITESGVTHVLISVDGLEETHNLFRGNASAFKAAINALQLCIENGLHTRVNTVLHKDNLKDIEGLLRITSELGVHQHSFFYLTPIGRGINLINKVLSLEEWKNVIQHVTNIATQINYLSKVTMLDLLSEDKIAKDQCRIFNKDNCLVTSNGDVYPCVFFVNSPYTLGNIHKTELFDIWTDDTLWRQFYIPRKKSCSSTKNCHNGCMGLAYLLTGKISVCDPRCQPNKGLIPSCVRRYVKYGKSST